MDAMIFETIILGEPVGEGRPRAVRMGPRVRVHAAPKSAVWRALAAQQMAAEWGERPACRECCAVTITAYMPRPQSRPKDVSKDAWNSGVAHFRRQKPDADNIAKAVLDAIVQAGILEDDTQVVDLEVRRVMCGSVVDCRPGVSIGIELSEP
jgi:Holliday junction resolvase RusA-like endonuclease